MSGMAIFCPPATTISRMIDLDAFIVPGKSAAGISIGSGVAGLLATIRPQSETKLSNSVKHDLGAVKVWSRDSIITQVGVYPGYRGILQPAIHIGSTISDVEQSFSCSVEEDEEDNLIVPNSPGWCFETEALEVSHTIRDNRNAKIVAIFVFKIR
jgi:hypothetical protein